MVRRLLRDISVVILCAATICCGRVQKERDAGEVATARVDYAALHYWDSYDFSSCGSSHDSLVMENAFSVYVSLLAETETSHREAAVDSLLVRVERYKEGYELINDMAWRYLDDPNSPFRDEDTFIIFLRHAVQSQVLPEEVRMRARYRLDQAMMNRPGMAAAGFPLTTREGVRMDFRDVIMGDTTLVMFYDPDCDQCKKISRELSRTPLPATLKIVGVDVVGDRLFWEKTKWNFPADWVVCFAEISLEDEEIYHFMALPTFYMYDKEGCIILKDPSPSLLFE